MKITKKLLLSDLAGEFGIELPEKISSDLKAEIGDKLVELILNDMNEGRSSVSGQKWKQLSKDYANAVHGGKTNAELFLEGDYQSALTYKPVSGGIEFGWFDKEQQGKADGHNNFTGESKLPLRRSIPTENESLRSGIKKQLKEIISEYADSLTTKNKGE